MNLSGGLSTVVMKPPVISRATPRPASISTSVAMMGWIRSTATRKPFQTPSTKRDEPTPDGHRDQHRAERSRGRTSRR